VTEAWAVLIAGVFAALAALVGLIITKESKTSDFRQEWIKELRKSFCEFNKLSVKIHNEYVLQNTFERTKKQAARGRNVSNLPDDDYAELNRLISEIKLRMNLSEPKDEENKLITMLDYWESVFDLEKIIFRSQYNELIEIQSKILKIEWERVKTGESAYKGLLYTLKCAFVVMVLLLFAFFVINTAHSLL